jgi:DNA modification methylase
MDKDKDKHNVKYGTVRQLIWEKINPYPSNGQYTPLSGIENAVYFKKHNAPYNANCENTVYRFPRGTKEIHDTEKNHDLLRELITVNSNPGDIVFDPCAGSGSTCLVARSLGRNYIGIELNADYFNAADARLRQDAKVHIPKDPSKIRSKRLEVWLTPAEYAAVKATKKLFKTVSLSDLIVKSVEAFGESEDESEGMSLLGL